MASGEFAVETEIQGQVSCLACEQINRSTARFCGRCGRTLTVACTKCGTYSPGHHLFCDACGDPLPIASLPDSDGSHSCPPSPVTENRGFFSRLKIRTTNLPGKLRNLGLTWDTPPPQWQWSLPFLRDWALRNRWELLAVVLLTAVAAFLRLYLLADIPAGFHGDEAWSGLEALRILNEGWIGIQSGSALGQAAGTFYFTALLIHFFDASIFTARLPMALFGIATIPASYLLFRVGFGRWVALFATSALTVSYWHVHMSRLSFPVIALPFACTLAAAAILLAMRSRSRLGWLIAGMMLGLGPYTYFAYPSFWLATFIVLAFYVYLQRNRLKPSSISVAFFALGLFLALIPVIYNMAASPTVQTGRIGQVWVFRSHEFPLDEPFSQQAAYFGERIWDSLTLLMRNSRGDGTDGTGGEGAVDKGIAALAYVGLVVAVTRWRSPPYLLALLAVLGALSVLVVTDPSTGAMRRTITAVPWVFGLAGVGAVGVVHVVRSVLGERGRYVAVGILVLVLLSGGAWNLRYYFDDLSQSQQFKWTFAPDHVKALESAHTFEDPGKIYFYSGRWSYDYETVRFLYPDSPGINRSQEFGTFDLTKLDDGPVTYVLIGHYAQEIDRLEQLYPGGEIIVDSEPRPRFIVYHLRS